MFVVVRIVEAYIIDERERVLRDAVANALDQVVSHHFVGLPDLVFVSLEVSLDVLLEQLFVQLVEVLVLVQFSEDIFVFHALETPHFLS